MEESDAIRNDRSRPYGRQHGEAIDGAGHAMRRFRRSRREREKARGGGRDRRGPWRISFKNWSPARRVADGAGRGSGPTLEELARQLDKDDIVIDGGNSHYIDDIRRAKRTESEGHSLRRTGTSGGVWGLERGYCQMIGGEKRSWCSISTRFSKHSRPARRNSSHARPRQSQGHRRRRLSALRTLRGRTLRQDGSQRNRIWHHGRFCRGLEYPEARQRRQATARLTTPKPLPCETPSITSTI